MTIRTRKETVTFRRPFDLASFDRTLPAGDYIVETDEELLEGFSFTAYRRVATLIHLHALASVPGQTQTLTIDPQEWDAARTLDAAPPGTQGHEISNQRTEAG